MLTYIANSLFAVYLPIYWVNLRLRERVAARRRASQEEAALVPAGSNPSDAMVQPLAAQSSKDLPDMTWRQLLRSALLVRFECAMACSGNGHWGHFAGDCVGCRAVADRAVTCLAGSDAVAVCCCLLTTWPASVPLPPQAFLRVHGAAPCCRNTVVTTML